MKREKRGIGIDDRGRRSRERKRRGGRVNKYNGTRGELIVIKVLAIVPKIRTTTAYETFISWSVFNCRRFKCSLATVPASTQCYNCLRTIHKLVSFRRSSFFVHLRVGTMNAYYPSRFPVDFWLSQRQLVLRLFTNHS